MLLQLAAVALLADAHTGKLLSGTPLSGTPSRISAHPGSAIKPFVLTALLQAGLIPAKPDFFCPGKLTVEGRSFSCSHPRLTTAMDARTALAYSCNNFFVHYASQLAPGALSVALSKYELIGASRRPIEALGEGSLTVTPTQLLEAYRRLALEQNQTVTGGLRDAVVYGTGQLAGISGFAVAGKTGTASPNYAWFAGFAPATHPDYVFAVLTRQASGGLGAAPLARQALLHQLGRDRELAVLTATGLQTLSLEDYVTGVLGGEAADLHSQEALRAMAVAARTFAVKLRGRHAADGYDFCGNTHCQSFRPAHVTPAIRAAVADTAALLLWREGSLAETFYSQDCSMRWSTTLTPAEIHLALETAHLHNPASLMPHVIDRDGQGRALRLNLGDGVPLAANSFRFAIGRTAGWNRIRSDFYDIAGLTFTGRGAGNGIGLCQRDADRMSGTYKQILSAFYPGTQTGLTAQGMGWQVLSGERVELWSTNAQQNRGTIAEAEQALRYAESVTELRTGLHPRVQIFPTVATFRDSTGEPGSVAASTKGRVIRLQPSAITPPIIRHEMLHLLLEENARPDLPLWYQEGLALALTGGPPPNDPAYLAYRRRAEANIRTFGKQVVIAWSRTGLPQSTR